MQEYINKLYRQTIPHIQKNNKVHQLQPKYTKVSQRYESSGKFKEVYKGAPMNTKVF